MDFFNQFPPLIKSLFIVICLGALLFILLKFVFSFFTKKLKVWAAKTETKIDDFVLVWISKTTSLFLLILSFYIAFHSSGENWEGKIERVVGYIFLTIMVIQCGIWGHHLIAELINQFNLKHNHGETKNPIYNVISFTFNLMLFVTLTLVFLANIGVNVQALVAGLGVGGIAIALAVQNILSDLFASVTIALDKPFEVGDFIVLDNFKGHIEKIGIKTTRIRSVTGEEIIVSNADLLKSKIRNYYRIKRRQVNIEFGVSYETPSEQLKEIPELCRKLISQMETCTFERCHFRNLGQYSLMFELVFWVEHKEHPVQLNCTQEFLLKLKGELEKKSISFAYPTQTIYLQQAQV
ncbi:MAG: mechanosensitive ion channel family protein [Bacteriovoracaceae bacterium]